MQHITNGTLTVTKGHDGTWYEEDKRRVQGTIKARYETGSTLIYVALLAFKDYCDLRKIPYSRTEKALLDLGVVTKKRIDLTRFTQGYPMIQATCLIVDLSHERMGGLPPIEVSDGNVVHLPARRP